MALRRPNWIPHLRGPWLSQRICYFHVPKCAGTAVLTAIKRRYRLHDHLLGHVSTLNAAASLRSAEIQQADRDAHRKILLGYFLSHPNHLFANGHVGCNRLLVDQFAQEWNFVTLLRDPVERWLSEYYYNRHKSSSHLRTELSLEEYLDDAAGRYNAQTYLNLFSSLPATAPDAERIDEALENLGRFALIGYTDALDEFVRQFQAVFGVPLSPTRSNLNPAPAYDALRNPAPQVRAAIEERCAADIELYRRIRARP